MSTPPSTPGNGTVAVQKSRKPPKRKPLSCLPCRQHKLRCDRQIPCGTCSRYRREDVCRLHPAPPKGKSRRVAAQHVGSSAVSGTEPFPQSHTVETAPFQATNNAQASRAPEQRSEQLVGHVHMKSAVQAINSTLATQTGSVLSHGQDPIGPSDPIVLFPQILPLLQLPSADVDTCTLLSTVDTISQKLRWKTLLVNLLPSRTQSDILFSYFVEHINWIFHTVHIPSFRKEYAQLWDGRVEDIDLIWLSLLFSIISLAALYVPVNAVEFVGLQGDTIRQQADLWHHASLQALQAGNYESKPNLTQLQTFSVTQLYWYATNNIEILNSRMAQAIRHAQMIGLDKDTVTSRNVEDEMRHRLWWDLVDSDTFQSICLERPPLIQVRFTNVPLPLNCNDIDIGSNFVHPKSMEEPTSMSLNIQRARIFQIINKVLVSDPLQFKSFNAISELDRQLLDIMEKLPWYFQLEADGRGKQFPASYDFLSWQHHILRTCVSTQRIRMYRPFLADRTNTAWTNCLVAVEDAMAVYRTLRENKSVGMRQKFFPQAYQVFSVAVTMVTMLLVERSMPHFTRFKRDIEAMTADLGLVDEQACPVPVAVNGRKVLLKMLALLEQGCSPEDAEGLVPNISSVIGGENTTRAYLGRRGLQESPSQVPLSDVTPQHQPRQQFSQNHEVNGVLQNEELTSAFEPIAQIAPDDETSLMPFPEPSDFSFDFDDFQLSDTYDLFGWDMTGLLSGAVASANNSQRLRTEEETGTVIL
ncbi:hypothetical protein LTR84_013172 [Exophiala bonariae]|uniref:Zn(2)-C6 fungal-type domain-containing protein n=1 Tax=Exophiala bonariae TaxID=1690606 RepID=A0AAV9NF90_9EURO|nr:hypothetical protein LTR84_013172 [Exophiala bonariae]